MNVHSVNPEMLGRQISDGWGAGEWGNRFVASVPKNLRLGQNRRFSRVL